MKKFLKTLLVMLLLGGGTWLVNLIWFKPWNINHFYDKVFLGFAWDNPELLSEIRMLEQFGIKAHQSRLNDESQVRQEQQLAKLRETLKVLQSYDRQSLAYDKGISYDIFRWFLEDQEQGLSRWRFHNYPVNQLFGVQNEFPAFMDRTHQIDTVRDANDYVSRLLALPVKFAQVKEGLLLREQRGIIPPTFVIAKVLTEMNQFVATPVLENILYQSFDKKLAKLSALKSDERQALLQSAETAIAQSVYPAYSDFIQYFTALQERSTSDAGVWKLPDGEAYYQYALESQTTLKLKPDELHNLGLSEVARIKTEMANILQSQGYGPERSPGQWLATLGGEARFQYPDTDAGREQILKDYQAIIDEISAGLKEYFSITPEAQVRVERIPVFKEKTAPGAYYNSPAIDGSRPGVFYANLADIRATEKFSMRTLAYHEAVPGHHFQIALAQEAKGLPLFRRMAPFTAYAEGWALYAEQVAFEAGFQNDPFDNLGRLQAELFRSVRLVVDTGLHSKRWTREQAIDYMRDVTGMVESDVIAEIERYIVNPGQACAYKVGMLKLLELRRDAQSALGLNFDMREFHNVILKNGSMPLVVLDQVVRDWIQKQSLSVSKAKV